MNKLTKAIIAILGACNRVMSMFIPIGLALVMINTIPALSQSNATILLIIATLSALFRAISLWVE